MRDPSEAVRRPSRLSPATLCVGLGLLLLSFVSGVVLWWGQVANSRFDGIDSTRLVTLQPWQLIHGTLNPFLCVFFGYLLCQHVRLGWQMKANRLSGAAMLAVMGGLILTGTGLYYGGDPSWREVLVWSHRVLGLLLPLTLAAHWIGAVQWAKKI